MARRPLARLFCAPDVPARYQITVVPTGGIDETHGGVQVGGAFPIVADVNGDGLDDLIQDKKIILNTGAAPVDVRELGLREMERVGGPLRSEAAEDLRVLILPSEGRAGSGKR